MSQKLRIAIVCDSIDNSNLYGSYISGKRFGAWLAKLGHEIIWITTKFDEEDKRKEFAYAKVYEFRGIKLWAYGVRFGYTAVTRLRKIFQKEKIDIMYSIHPSPLGRQAIRAAKRLHIPAVSHSHIRPELNVRGAPKFVGRLFKMYMAGIYKKCNGLIYPTAFAKKIFDDCNFKMKQAVIGNGVDTNIFHPDEKVDQNTFTILYVGRLDVEKNLPILIDALHILYSEKKLGHIRCIFVGWWNIEKKLQQRIVEHWLWEVVKCTGRMPSASPRLVKAFQEASVFVLPSLYETEWMVVLEAMACGCPLLISDSPTSAAKEFVHNNGYTFDCKDPKDLAKKIYKLSINPDLCQLMSEVSLEEAQKYSFTTSVEKLELFLSSFVKHT